MKLFYSLLSALFLILACSPSKMSVHLSNLSAIADTYANASPAALELSKSLNGQKKSEMIKLPKGRYHFHEAGAITREFYISNHDQDNPKKIGFVLENVENLIIDGGGAELFFNGHMIPIILHNCKNISLRNFSVDFSLPHIRQLNILSKDNNKHELTAEIIPAGNFIIEDNKLFITGEGYKYQPDHAMAFQQDRRLAYQRADVAFNPGAISEIGNNKLLLKNWKEIERTSVGDRFALRTYHRPAPGIVISESKNIKIENVTIHYAEGMGLLAQMSENITLNKFSVKLRGDEDPRYFTTQADATHFSACKGLIISENGLYEGMADDAINVHGTYLKIIERKDNHTIVAKYMHPQAYGFRWGGIGDAVQIIETKSMELLSNSENKIKSIRPIDKPSVLGAKIFELVLEKEMTIGSPENNSYAIENLTWTPEVIFKDNIVRNNRARGALFSTPRRVICENNNFDHTHGTAILLCGDANGWYETGACKNVLIRNNIFTNALTANYQFTNAIISIYPEIPDLKSQQKFFHSGIVIENNLFRTFDRPLLYAKSTEGLLFKNNTIEYNNEFEPFHWNTYLFNFQRVNGVQIVNNKFGKDFSANKDIKIDMSSPTAVKIIPKKP